MAWDGRLDHELDDLYHLFKMSTGDENKWNMATTKALIAAKVEYNFNHAVLTSALVGLDDKVSDLFSDKQSSEPSKDT